jgi:hypothetical protein
MKSKLILKKYNNCYALNDYREPSKGYPLVIAHSDDKDFKYNLSKQNCDEIFGVVDVEKYVEEYAEEFKFNERIGFRDGFNKAVELNKDKVFTLEQTIEMAKILVSNPYETSGKKPQELVDAYIKSIQQPTKIEVEIVVKNSRTGKVIKSKFDLEWDEDGLCDMAVPKLDSEGCLILKRVV